MKSRKMLMGLIITLLLVNFNFVFAQDPIADYSFDVDASDAIGNFNGTLEGDAAIVDDAVRGKVLFLENDGYVIVPSEVTATMDNFSFTAWMDYNGSNEWAGLLGMGIEGGGSAPYWDFHVCSNGNISFYASEIATWPGDGSAQIIDFNLFDLEPGWVHIALTFSMGSVPLCYVNGEVQTSTDWNSSNDHDVSPKLIEPDEVAIGRDCFNQNTLTNTKIDDFVFFDTALTADDVTAVYNGNISDVENLTAAAKEFSLAQNYPNPFNPSTRIDYTLGKSSNVELSVYNVTGQKVATLVNGLENVGNHHVVWNASEVPAGIYLYELKTDHTTQIKKMMLVK